MKDYQGITLTRKDFQTGSNGYKVVKVEVSVPTENLYAVCTPVKLK
ncbi:hypothetical protein [Evansella tamaricis]|uniref:Uncharacterized protein n=1 Tax=Evansella tamaricis TaxID=2069301 RepID=A0ABS6JH74_9BACI|nr:hypothetical protein [Evansella tamaricis]MBU9713026.1 hypothetical protein [Evansella tamaricis]